MFVCSSFYLFVSVVLVFLLIKHRSVSVGTVPVDVVQEPSDNLIGHDSSGSSSPTIDSRRSVCFAHCAPTTVVRASGVGVCLTAALVVLINSFGEENTSEGKVDDGSGPAANLGVPSGEPHESLCAPEVTVPDSDEGPGSGEIRDDVGEEDGTGPLGPAEDMESMSFTTPVLVGCLVRLDPAVRLVAATATSGGTAAR